jgi:hypothetical protein|tara:strand:- start:293 stop:505 length:213 start_codon:yes stop_codon:yes gene_type:complete
MADKIDFLDGLPLSMQKTILDDISKLKDDRHEKIAIEIDDTTYMIPKAVNDLIDCLYRDIQVNSSGIQKD